MNVSVDITTLAMKALKCKGILEQVPFCFQGIKSLIYIEVNGFMLWLLLSFVTLDTGPLTYSPYTSGPIPKEHII